MRKIVFLLAVLTVPLFVTACGVTNKTTSAHTSTKDVALTTAADVKATATTAATTVITETANTFIDVPSVTLQGTTTFDELVLKPLEVENSDLLVLVTLNSDKQLVATAKTKEKRLPVTIDKKTVTNAITVSDLTDKTVTNTTVKQTDTEKATEVKRSRVGWNTLLGFIGFSVILGILILGWRYIQS